MPSPVELLKQESKEAHFSPQMTTPSLQTPSYKTPNKQDHGQYFCSSQFQTPSARATHMQVSGHSISPHLKTPSSGSSRGTPHMATPGSSGSRRLTPRFYTTPGGSTRQIVRNPFEGQLLEKLKSNSPMFSPNMFKVTDPGSAEKSPQVFRWSIDQIAILKPAELEEMPVQQDTLNIIKDPAEEARVQEAIDSYFSAGYIVPSPWTENVRKVILPRTPDAEREKSMTLLENMPPEMLSSPLQKHEASCQTMLTLPVDFDLQEILGEHYTYTSSQQQPQHDTAAAQTAALFPDTESQADLSTSSLRRKLFFHGDEGTPLSPVRSNKSRIAEVMDMSSPAVSPVRSHTSLLSKQSSLQTPASSHFSSSPIRGLEQTPSLRRCSTAPSLINSPEISPISNSCSSKGSGIIGTPMCLPLEATPSSGRPSSRKIDSPGISPIGQGNNGSYVQHSPQDKLMFSSSDSLRRRALIGQTEKRATSPDLICSPIIAHAKDSPLFSPQESFPGPSIDLKGLRDAKCRIDFDLPHDLSHNMDISCHKDNVEYDEDEEGYDDRLPSAFRNFRENYEYDCENTTGFQTMCNEGTQSQDTGYQTQNSQSAINEATMSSNLTNHFSNLPAAFDGCSKDNSPTDPDEGLRQSLEEMSDFYSKISHSISEMTPSSRNEKMTGVAHPFSSTMLSPPNAGAKDKPMEQVFAELQQFANKFSKPNFSTARQGKGVATENGTPKLHKSYSVGEFHIAFSERDRISNCDPGTCKSTILFDANSQSSHGLQGSVQFDAEHQGVNKALNCDMNIDHDLRRAQDAIAHSSACEHIGDIPKFDKAVRPKILHRSISDCAGSRMFFDQTQSDDLFLSQGLYKGRPAHNNPAFTIETLTPNSGPEQQTDTRLTANRDGYSQISRAAKLGSAIRPRLLFAEDESGYNEESHLFDSTTGTKTEHLSESMQQKRKAPLLDTQLSPPERLWSTGAHPSSSTSQEIETKLHGAKAKRLLGQDHSFVENTRSKRRSPTWDLGTADTISLLKTESGSSELRHDDVTSIKYEESKMDC